MIQFILSKIVPGLIAKIAMKQAEDLIKDKMNTRIPPESKIDLEQLKKDLIKDEGEVLTLYKCPANKWTIGVGRNVEDRGISHDESMFLLQNDISLCIDEVISNFDWFERLNSARQAVLVNMCFNLGISRLKGFKNMLFACSQEHWNTAANEMLDSKWAKQVGSRAVRLSEQMRSGIWQLSS